MKRYISYILIAACLLTAGGCKKKNKEEIYPKFPPPGWTNETTGKYTSSMTAVVKLPRDLDKSYQASDELAAFIGEECRAVAEVVEVAGERLFYLLIQGEPSAGSQIRFRYYSTSSSYIYHSDNVLNFSIDGSYGNADQPVTLALKPK